MSIKIISQCWGRAKKPIPQQVLISIAYRCNDVGDGCWASLADHAKRTRLSERSVQRAIRELEEEGLISVLERPGQTSLISINLEKLCDNKKHEELSTTPATRSGVGGDTESPHPRQTVTPPPSQSHPTPDSLTPKPSITFNEPSTTTTEPVVVANDNYFCFGIQKPADMESERWLSLSVAAEGKRNPAGWLTDAIRNDWVVGSARSPLSDEFIRKNARPGETWEQVRTRLSRSQSQCGSGGNMIQISDMFQFETQKKPLDHAGSSGFK